MKTIDFNFPHISGFISLLSAANFFSDMLTNTWSRKPNVFGVYSMVLFSFSMPLFLFSLFSSEMDPLELLPLTVPIVLLNAHHLRKKFLGGKVAPLLSMWYAFNLILGVYSGLLRESCLLSSIRTLPGVTSAETAREAHVLFARTPPPPKFQLLQSRKGRVVPYLHSSDAVRFHFHHMSGSRLFFPLFGQHYLTTIYIFFQTTRQLKSFLS